MADDNSVSERSSSSDDEDSPTSVQTKIKREHCQPKARKFSVTYEKFLGLPFGKNCEVQSSKFSCFGYDWRLQLFPGGYRGYPRPPKETVGVCVERCDRAGKWPNVKFSFEVKSTDGKTSLQTSSDPSKRRYYSSTSDTCGLASRLDIKSRFLDDKGALTIYLSPWSSMSSFQRIHLQRRC